MGTFTFTIIRSSRLVSDRVQYDGNGGEMDSGAPVLSGGDRRPRTSFYGLIDQ